MQFTPRYANGSDVFESASSLTMTPLTRSPEEDEFLKEIKLETNVQNESEMLARIDTKVSEILKELRRLTG